MTQPAAEDFDAIRGAIAELERDRKEALNRPPTLYCECNHRTGTQMGPHGYGVCSECLREKAVV